MNTCCFQSEDIFFSGYAAFTDANAVVRYQRYQLEGRIDVDLKSVQIPIACRQLTLMLHEFTWKLCELPYVSEG